MAGFMGMNSKQWDYLGSGASGLLQGIGGYQSYRAQAGWQSSSAEVNEKKAVEVVKKAAWEVTRQRIAKRKWIGGAQAMYGWAGVEMEGSPTDAVVEANREMTMDEMMTTREGYIEQQMLLQEAKWNREAAKSSKKAANLSMIGGLAQAGIGAAGVFAFSDERLKENIHPVSDALKKLRDLTAYRYNFRGSDQERIGMLAQEIEKQFPEAVQDRSGAKAVELYALQSLIVGAINELKTGPATGFGSFA